MRYRRRNGIYPPASDIWMPRTTCNWLPGIQPVMTPPAIVLPTLETFPHQFDPMNVDEYTFNFDIGSTPSRHFIITVGWGLGVTIESCTIAGQTFTQHILGSVGAQRAAILSTDAEVTASGVQDIVITFSGDAARAAVDLWAAENLQSPTPVSVDADTDSDSLLATLLVNTGSVVVAFGIASNNPTQLDLTGVTQEANLVEIEVGVRFSSGSTIAIAPESAHAVTATLTGGTVEILCAASFS